MTHNTTELLNAVGGNPGTSYDSRHGILLKHELYQTKRQLADAQNSYQFIKREKMRIEHEKRLIEIQMQQMEEAYGLKRQDEDAMTLQIRELQK